MISIQGVKWCIADVRTGWDGGVVDGSSCCGTNDADRCHFPVLGCSDVLPSCGVSPLNEAETAADRTFVSAIARNIFVVYLCTNVQLCGDNVVKVWKPEKDGGWGMVLIVIVYPISLIPSTRRPESRRSASSSEISDTFHVSGSDLV
jgi:hypothetical protein